MKTITLNGTEYRCPHYDAMPRLSDQERHELRESIRAIGITVPIVVVRDNGINEVIDGHHRLEIAAELLLPEIPIKTVTGLSDAEKSRMAIDLNLHRRHLTREQRQEIITARLKADPERSNRDIAAEVKVDDKTVAVVRKKLESTAEIPQLKSTRGMDGRVRSTSKAPSPIMEKPEPTGEAPQADTPTERGFKWKASLDSMALTLKHNFPEKFRKLSLVKKPDRKLSEVVNLLDELIKQVNIWRASVPQGEGGTHD